MSVKERTRNAALTKMAAHLRRCGLQRHAIEVALIAFTEEKCQPRCLMGRWRGLLNTSASTNQEK